MSPICTDAGQHGRLRRGRNLRELEPRHHGTRGRHAPMRFAASSKNAGSTRSSPANPIVRSAFGMTSRLTGAAMSSSAAPAVSRIGDASPALHPLYRRTHAHPEMFGSLAPRRSRLHCFDHASPQVTRIRLRHRPPRIGESMRKDRLIPDHLRVLQIQIRRDPL
jgi:hypothetical protein